MNLENFKELKVEEQMKIDGGIFGVDDALVVTVFLATLAIGADVACNNKNRQ